MSSEKQEQANARNAQLSTGPISPEGKAAVARNAVKHGIFAKDLVIAAGDGRENEFEYQKLLADLKRDLAPMGRMEMLLVEKIAVNYWRLRRLVRYETGEIRERLDDFRESALRSYYNSSYLSRHRPDLEYFTYEDDISDVEYHKQLSKAAAMRSPNLNMVEEKSALEYVLYCRLDRVDIELTEKDYRAAKKYVGGLSPQLRGKLRKEMLEEAEKVLAEMNEVRAWSVKFDRIQKAMSLPLEKDLNKVVKYENSLERSIFRNVAALKTLQENRANRECGENDLVELPASDG